MTSKARATTTFQRAAWVVVSLLLLISAGLPLFAWQALGQVCAATILLALYLAMWSYVMSLVGLVFFSVRCLMNWRRMRLTRASMSLRNEGLEEPEPEGTQSLGHDDVSPIVPSRLSRHNNDLNKGARYPESREQQASLQIPLTITPTAGVPLSRKFSWVIFAIFRKVVKTREGVSNNHKRF